MPRSPLPVIAFPALLLAVAVPEPAGGELELDVRVGVVAFQDSRGVLERNERMFADLLRGSGVPIRFRLATGTYADVLHWIDRSLIDVAVLSPGVFAETLRPGPAGATDPRCQFLAMTRLPPARSPLAGEERRQPGPHYQYHSICVVPGTSSLRDMADLHRAVEEGRAQFLFVHPLSVSGRIAPEFAMQQVGIRVTRTQVRYTYSHNNSLRLLGEPSAGQERVAFLWDDAVSDASDLAPAVRAIPFPELERLAIPADVVAARPGLPLAERLASILAEHVDAQGEHDFARPEDWSERYGVIREWSGALGLPADEPQAQTVSIDELGWVLLHYARSQPKPPRIALVLSGGGAKCAYQVGAVAALEEKLESLRKENPGQGLDFALVVGTSGGAINALPVALGISATPEGRAEYQRVWEELDQREIVRPSLRVRGNMSLWFAILQAAIVLWAVRRLVPERSRRGWWLGTVLVLLAGLELTLAYVPTDPWRWLGTNHIIHHAWLWAGFGMFGSAFVLLGLGGTVLIVHGWLTIRRIETTFPARLFEWVLAIGLFGLPLAQTFTVLFQEKTLSEGSGIERVLAEKFHRLVNGLLDRSSQPPIEVRDAASAAERLRAVSRQILERRLLKRDLVLTGSCLSRTSRELPADLYFYAAVGPGSPAPGFGPLGVSLAERPSILLDVIMGSGAIFPVFPPRILEGLPRSGDRVELIDGGFAHNSPIEAAVLWGATHIVLIEASPIEHLDPHNFAENAIGAFLHLYYQAQLIDARKKEQVVIFTLRPEAPHPCVLDFSRNLIHSTVEKGYRDARGEVQRGRTTLLGQPTFRKEVGEPLFQEMTRK